MLPGPDDRGRTRIRTQDKEALRRSIWANRAPGCHPSSPACHWRRGGRVSCREPGLSHGQSGPMGCAGNHPRGRAVACRARIDACPDPCRSRSHRVRTFLLCAPALTASANPACSPSQSGGLGPCHRRSRARRHYDRTVAHCPNLRPLPCPARRGRNVAWAGMVQCPRPPIRGPGNRRHGSPGRHLVPAAGKAAATATCGAT